MSDKRIDDVTPDTNVTGTELLPVSDAGTPKSMTVERVKDFVLTKIVAIAAASGVDTANDSVYIKQGNALKPVSAATLASAVVDYAFGLASASTLAGTDEIVLSQSDTEKTTTLSSLAAYVKDTIQLDAFNVHGLTETTQPLSDEDETPLAQETNSFWSTVKATLGTLKTFILGGLPSFATTSSAALANDDSILAIDGTSGDVKKVTISNSGVGKGNVVGPSANTSDNIPQWDGNNTKTLKNGLSVTASVNSSSSSSQIPTAAAVYAAVYNKVIAPATNSANHIPLWDGAGTKTLKNGMALISSVTSASTHGEVPTGKAVYDSLSFKASAPATNTDGKIPQWNGANSKTLKDGLSVVTSVDISGSADDSSVPTEKAVRDALGEYAKNVESPANGNIPVYGNDGNFDVQYPVANDFDEGASTQGIPTANAVYEFLSDNVMPLVQFESGLSSLPSTCRIARVSGNGNLYYRAGNGSWYKVAGTAV